MLGAMVAEAVAVPACRARGLQRAELSMQWPQWVQPVASGGWQTAWREALAWADAVWLVAPETAGELETLSREVEAAGRRLLSSSPAAVAVAASKSACHAALAGRVRQPADLDARDGWVVKPDDGVAAEGVRRLVSGRAGRPGQGLTDAEAVVAEPPPGHIVQPFVAGEALSLCVLSDGDAARVLSVNQQDMDWDADGAARYCGGVSNARADRDRFLPMARAVQAAIPGLWGCWGVDLVLPSDGEAVLIEVNPRLTTAFAHLRAATGFCLLEALLALAAGRPLASLAEVPIGRAVAFRLATALEAAR